MKDEELEAQQLCLSVAADCSVEYLIEMILSSSKVSSTVGKLEAIVSGGHPGIELHHLPFPPGSIPLVSRHTYFYVNQRGQDWDDVYRFREISFYIPGKIPNLFLRLYSIPQGMTCGKKQ
jgi:type VI secretion system protein ImpJ